jgi:hypothetical protein
MFESFENLEGEILKQAKTLESKNLLKEVINKCKGEKKSPKETFSEINQLIVCQSFLML